MRQGECTLCSERLLSWCERYLEIRSPVGGRDCLLRSDPFVGDGVKPGEVLDLILHEGLSPLAAWRRHRGLSQAEVARRAGLSQGWVSRIEAGGGYGSRRSPARLAAALAAPVWALERGEDQN